jgi:Ca2+-binding EF-hand superfamily protein
MARSLFAEFDSDASGAIDGSELSLLVLALLHKTGRQGEDEETVASLCTSLLEEADTDANGTIDFDEFVGVFNQILRLASGSASLSEFVDLPAVLLENLESAVRPSS